MKIVALLLLPDTWLFHHGEPGIRQPGATPGITPKDWPTYVPPYLNKDNTRFQDQDGYPAITPPRGTLSAIDLNTGTENHGGPVVTAGSLVFIAATYDEKLRAFDKETGRLVWTPKLPAGGFATAITYLANGKQYVVIAAGGTRYDLQSGGSYVAFALP